MVCHLSRSVQRFRRDVASTKTRICFIIIDILNILAMFLNVNGDAYNVIFNLFELIKTNFQKLHFDKY